MMWEDEKALVISGERDPDKKEDYSYIGHYLNMKGNYKTVACGVALTEDGKKGWLNINFFNAHAIPAANGLAMTPHALAALLTVAFAVSFAMAVYAENGKMKLLYGVACVLMAAAAQMSATKPSVIIAP